MLKEKMNNFIDNKILEYSEINSQKEPNLLKELNKETHLKILNPRMLSGAFQGRLLSLISKLINPEKVLEIGTYTGYSALCLYEGLDKKGVIHTIDKNEELWTEGYIDGIISETIIGDRGFGYDPVFFVPDIGKTFAELSSDEKNKNSHRGIALQKLRKILLNVLK